jgi:tRNA(fMet)-specific endonuclease VapC
VRESIGQIRSRLAQAGLTIGPNDLLIAATAIAFGAILITYNTRKFSRVEELSREDWEL